MDTFTLVTVIIHRAIISVVTWSVIIRVVTLSVRGITRIIGALFVVIAVSCVAFTQPIAALVTKSTFVAIIAISIVVPVRAPRPRIAGIVSTRVAIVTIFRLSANTISTGTAVVHGTLVAIIARSGVPLVLAYPLDQIA
jgi:hypothetical protein